MEKDIFELTELEMTEEPQENEAVEIKYSDGYQTNYSGRYQ